MLGCGLSLRIKAYIFGLGLGLAARGLGLEVETYRPCCEMYFSSTMSAAVNCCKLSEEDNKPLWEYVPRNKI